MKISFFYSPLLGDRKNAWNAKSIYKEKKSQYCDFFFLFSGIIKLFGITTLLFFCFLRSGLFLHPLFYLINLMAWRSTEILASVCSPPDSPSNVQERGFSAWNSISLAWVNTT